MISERRENLKTTINLPYMTTHAPAAAEQVLHHALGVPLPVFPAVQLVACFIGGSDSSSKRHLFFTSKQINLCVEHRFDFAARYVDNLPAYVFQGNKRTTNNFRLATTSLDINVANLL